MSTSLTPYHAQHALQLYTFLKPSQTLQISRLGWAAPVAAMGSGKIAIQSTATAIQCASAEILILSAGARKHERAAHVASLALARGTNSGTDYRHLSQVEVVYALDPVA